MEKTTAYVNAKIYTMENDGAACEAIAVHGGRFVYCGSSEQAAAMAGDVIDLQGKTVIPGLIDTHIHLFPYACNLERLLLDKVTSVRELQEKLPFRLKTSLNSNTVFVRRHNNGTFIASRQC